MSTPDPNAIPNMSLDDRDERPPPSPAASPAPPASAPASAYQPTVPVTPSPLPPIEIASDVPKAAPLTWAVDARVLAPWEPDFLYSGTILRIEKDEAKGDRALIAFDDNDEGWVYVDSLEPIVLKKNTRVYSRKNMGPQHLPAKIGDVDGETVFVEFDNGFSEWTRVGSLRIPCVPNGPGATPTHIGANRAPLEYADPGAGDGGSGGAIPGWVIWIGVSILIGILRVGCRSMMN